METQGWHRKGSCRSWALGLRHQKGATGGDLLLTLLWPWFVTHTNQEEHRVQTKPPPSQISAGQPLLGFVAHTC